MNNRVYDIPWKEKQYNGTVYRSTLEARWAVFLDALKILHTYEKKVFYFQEFYGTPSYVYHPDFALLDCPYNYLEIKPTPPTPDEYAKCIAVSKRNAKIALLAGPVHPEKIGVFLFENGRRVYPETNAWFYVQCATLGISWEQGQRIASLKAVFGKRDYTKGFKAAWEAFK